MAGLYIHIPFCAKRCIYCDFYSNTNVEYKEAYIFALLREMEMRRSYLQGERINTIYFGGGTPSLLQICDLGKIFNGIYRIFPVSDNPEITIEANPDDLSSGYIASLATLPVNRISIGIQSFIDEDLRFLNRRHSADEAVEAVRRCQDAGMENICLDLIYGLPGQTMEKWSYNMEKAIGLDVPHISAYNLSYEEGTVLYDMMKKGEALSVDDDLSELFFYSSVETLANAGFVHYEISNFAKRSASYPEGRISLHNSSYWDGTYYLGLGASAHSYDGTHRSWNISSISEYIKSIRDEKKIPCETEYLDERTRYNDFVITRMRTMRGVSLKEIKKEFSEEFQNYFFEKSEPLLCLNKLKKYDDNVKVSLNSIFVSDAIIRDLVAL